MTDVQVSNARRIGFTALALVSFWVLAWKAYWVGVDWVGTPHDEWVFFVGWGLGGDVLFGCRFAIVGLLSAIIPSALLSLSVTNSFLNLRTRFVLWAALLMAACSVCVCWLGESASVTHWGHLIETGKVSHLAARAPVVLYNTHPVSWLWLLPAIILTTAFVIFGAWRRAVRDDASDRT